MFLFCDVPGRRFGLLSWQVPGTVSVFRTKNTFWYLPGTALPLLCTFQVCLARDIHAVHTAYATPRNGHFFVSESIYCVRHGLDATEALLA